MPQNLFRPLLAPRSLLLCRRLLRLPLLRRLLPKLNLLPLLNLQPLCPPVLAAMVGKVRYYELLELISSSDPDSDSNRKPPAAQQPAILRRSDRVVKSAAPNGTSICISFLC